MCHLRKSVHNDKHEILSILRSRQTKHKVHANIFPWVIWNWKWHIEAMRLGFGLSFATCRASVGEAIDVAKHLEPKVVLGERSKCLVASKVSHESASMRFLQKQQAKRGLGDAKFVSSHKISIFDVVSIPRSMHPTLGIRYGECRIMFIQVFDMLKTNDIQLKVSDKHAYTGKRIRHNIFFTLNVLDGIRKRLNEFTPFSMTLVQLSLTLKILKRFMVGMDDKFMRAKVMFPFM